MLEVSIEYFEYSSDNQGDSRQAQEDASNEICMKNKNTALSQIQIVRCY